MAPPLDRMVERPELGRRLVATLTAGTPVEGERITVLQGAGGFGKTRLARWACHQPEVLQRFAGGLLWVTVGQETRGADLALRVNDTIFALSGQRPAISDPDAAGAELGRLLDEREPILLVVDDIWEETQLRPFRFGGRRCTRLVTTRIPDIALHGECIVVDTMTSEQARQLIGTGLSDLPAEPTAELAELAGHWPILLNLVNGALRRRAVHGQPPDEAAREVIRQLKSDGPGAFDPTRAADRSQAVEVTVGASMALLHPDDQQRYIDLGIFPEDVDIPLDILELLWPGRRVGALCEELVALGLASDYRLDWPGARLVMHDVVRAYLHVRGRSGTRVEAHGRLIDMAAKRLPTGYNETRPWWLLHDDSAYLWRYLPYHLDLAGRHDELAGLLQDLRWIEAKTRRFGSAVPVKADLELIDTPVTAILRHELVNAALLLGPIHPPAALGATLASRLRDVPGLEAVVNRYRTTLPRPYLDPVWPLPDRPSPTAQSRPGHTGAVTSCAFSPTAPLLATTSDDGTARLWSLTTRTELRVISGHTGSVWDCAFSPDGTLLATASTDWTVRLWHVDSGEQVAVLRGHTEWVRSCAFSPDGTLLASTSADMSVRLWRVPEGKQIAVLSGHSGEIRSCAFSPDGTLLVTVSTDGTGRVWRVGDGSQQAILTGHSSGLWGCAFSHDGRLLATTSPGTVKLWQVHDLSSHVTITVDADEVNSCSFSPDGTTLATTSYGRVWQWNVADATLIKTVSGHTGAVWKCTYSPDGSVLATASNDQTARLWPADTLIDAHVLGTRSDKVNSCAFSPDGRTLATTSYDGTVQLRRVADGAEQAMLVGHTSRVISCAFSPDGQLLATTSHKTVRLWRVADHQPERELTGHTDWVRSCAFSPDGRTLATASGDRTVRLWRVADGAPLTTFTDPNRGFRSCAFSPDGLLLAAANASGQVRLWRVGDGAEHVIMNGHTGSVASCVFSPDGTLLATASGDRSVRLWRVSDGAETMSLVGHTSWADRCAFSPDGALLATASNDQTVRLWDVATGECLCALRVAGPVVWVAWHPGGRLLCTVGAAGVYLLRYESRDE
ncbi:NB-ARC domain-containing protein [Allorhizocola rhizosphaerae]|uniref:WD40 domain-containing protein n=1 Tax=Allorhizocola rhizosphaerae TaxID=1872709 RepID=UPI0013C31DDD|nr:NB-ARC domain-containing protein [Allorhizocola rhizosphaerae]